MVSELFSYKNNLWVANSCKAAFRKWVKLTKQFIEHRDYLHSLQIKFMILILFKNLFVLNFEKNNYYYCA